MKEDIIIMVAGKKRAGKDTFTNILADKIDGVHRVALADPMKDILAFTLDYSTGALEELKNDSKRPHRGYLQRFGEYAKKYFGQDCWVNITKHTVANLPKGSIAVISDFRYPNEELDNAITVQIINDRVEDIVDTHSSENALEKFKFSYSINNSGSIKELENAVDAFIDYYGLPRK